MITILGPTATGKTALAAHVAYKLDGEIISADSRQVYKGMDIGTGKDLKEYSVEGKPIPYHLIDIKEPGYEYSLFEYLKDFHAVYPSISSSKPVVFCGGTGLYLEAVLKGYEMAEVPVNDVLHNELGQKPEEELIALLASFRNLHNTTDTNDKKRLIRAVEIELWKKDHPKDIKYFPAVPSRVFGISYPVTDIRKRITLRLKERLSNGMIEEVDGLLKTGLSPQQIMFYGLEYKFITLFLIGQLNRNDMFQKLNSAIHQFAKRQMTWFRRMEKNGIFIHWIDGKLSLEKKVEVIFKEKGF